MTDEQRSLIGLDIVKPINKKFCKIHFEELSKYTAELEDYTDALEKYIAELKNQLSSAMDLLKLQNEIISRPQKK